MKFQRILFGFAAIISLAGCSERVIASAGETMLVVVEDIRRDSPVATATVHYVMAKPYPMSPGAPPAEQVVRMRYEGDFDCSSGTWGERVHETTTADGRVMTNRTPTAILKTPSPDSVGHSVLRAVCERGFYETHRTRRPQRSIEKTYLDQRAVP